MKLRTPALVAFVFALALLAAGGAKAAPYVDTLPNGAINAGAAFKYTVFTLGGDMNIDNSISLADVYGDVGVGGNGNFSMTNGTIHGNLWYRSGGKVKVQGPSKVTGTQMADDANLNQAVMDSQNLSMAAASEVQTAFAPGNAITHSFSLTGGPNQKVVLDITNFQLGGSDTFTLNGTATTTFIINISNQFSLSGSAAIVLNGVPTANVLFNVTGTGADVQKSGNSIFRGTLLATQRKIGLSLGYVYGRVIGNAVTLSSGVQVVSQ